MKFSELFSREVSLIGKTVGHRVVTKDTQNNPWMLKFDCSGMGLTTLQGAPMEVDGTFSCGNNKLTTLKGAPKNVHGGFWCEDNQLTTLEDGPDFVFSSFVCSNNKLTTLKGAPKSTGYDVFNCSDNQLTSLEYAPKKMRGHFWCSRNNITNLHDIHKIIILMEGEFVCQKNPITSHVLGLLLIPGLKRIESTGEWYKILNKYLGKGRKGLIDCQNELIEAGLEEYAQL